MQCLSSPFLSAVPSQRNWPTDPRHTVGLSRETRLTTTRKLIPNEKKNIQMITQSLKHMDSCSRHHSQMKEKQKLGWSEVTFSYVASPFLSRLFAHLLRNRPYMAARPFQGYVRGSLSLSDTCSLPYAPRYSDVTWWGPISHALYFLFFL